MTLQLSYLFATNSALTRRMRDLINAEPARDHEILDCWNPECESCERWRQWAGQLREVNTEIKNRETTQQKSLTERPLTSG